MQPMESFLHQRFALLLHHAPQLIAILQKDVSTNLLFANLPAALLTNAILLPTNVNSLFLTVMMAMLVPPIASVHHLAVFILQNALLLMHVPLLLAATDFAPRPQRTATILTLALPTLAILALELAFILLLSVLVTLEAWELAILKPLNA